MTISYRATVTCRGCGAPAPVEVYQSVTAWVDPPLVEAVLDNRLNRLDCPKCGRVGFIDSELLFNDAAHGFLVQFVTSRTAHLAQLEDDLKRAVAHEPQLLARMVITRNAFLEKVRVLTCGLDDIAIEVLKVLLKPQLPVNLRDAELRFEALVKQPAGERLSFVATAPEVAPQAVSIPRSAHDNAVARYVEPNAAMRHAEIFVDDRIATRLLARKSP